MLSDIFLYRFCSVLFSEKGYLNIHPWEPPENGQINPSHTRAGAGNGQREQTEGQQPPQYTRPSLPSSLLPLPKIHSICTGPAYIFQHSAQPVKLFRVVAFFICKNASHPQFLFCLDDRPDIVIRIKNASHLITNPLFAKTVFLCGIFIPLSNCLIERRYAAQPEEGPHQTTQRLAISSQSQT